MFLKNNFAGNARENLLKTLVVHEIMTDHEVEECLRYYFKLFLWLTGLGTKHRKYVDTGSGEEALWLLDWHWHCIAHCIEGDKWGQCSVEITWPGLTSRHDTSYDSLAWDSVTLLSPLCNQRALSNAAICFSNVGKPLQGRLQHQSSDSI